MTSDALRSFLLLVPNSFSGQLPLVSSLFKTQNTGSHINGDSECKTARPSAWETVDQDPVTPLDVNASYWWRSSGHTLSILLDKAGYPYSSRCQLLAFFKTLCPNLGPARVNGTSSWKSFMTDDHNPIELSWDWQTGGKDPKVRLSIEPVGSFAGTSRDPNNSYAAAALREMLPASVPSANMTWLSHFQSQLSVETENTGGVDGHASTEFYAFDLAPDGSIISKAYFFPGYKAKSSNKSSLEICSQAIATAPEATPDKLEALRVFQDFASDHSGPPLEMELLAVDLIQPSQSRFKIYFRVRDTCFASFKHVMSLGNRVVDNPAQRRGLAAMKRLYEMLFVAGSDKQWAEHMQLPASHHRTGGFLYFAEFKYGSTCPKVKAYLPVRHYAASEEATLSAVQSYLRDNKSLSRYLSAMRTIL